MTVLLYTLKMFTDICYYMIFASFAAGKLGAGGMQLQTVILVAISGLCRVLSGTAAASEDGTEMFESSRRVQPVLRYLPLILMLLFPLLPGGVTSALLCLPPAVYVSYTTAKRLFHADAGETSDRFTLFMKILPAPLLGAYIFGGGAVVNAFSFPYIVLYIFCSVLLLRMLRHDPEVLRQRRFRILNALELGCVFLLTAALFSRPFRAAVSAAAGAVYRWVLAPVLLLVSYVFVGVGWLLSKLLAPLDMSGRERPELELADMENLAETLKVEQGSGSAVLGKILLALGILAACTLLFLLFKRMLGRKSSQSSERTFETRTALTSPSGQPARRNPFLRRSEPEQVRRWYWKYLHLAQSRGAQMTPFQNTMQQRGEAGGFLGGPGEQNQLRGYYLPARYDGHAEPEDVREAKRLYEAVKKADR